MKDTEKQSQQPDAQTLWRRVLDELGRSCRSRQDALDDTQWERQNDEISKTIWRLTSVLGAACIFCLLTLGAPDATLVATDAKITVPITGTQVSYSGFLFFGPVFLIGLTAYLHVYIEQQSRLGVRQGKTPLPFLFNLNQPAASVLSGVIFYCTLPFVLAVFSWKALPRPDAPLFLFLTAAVTSLMILLGMRQFAAEQQGQWTKSAKFGAGVLSVLLVGSIVYVALLTPAAVSALRGLVTAPADGGPVPVARASLIPLPTRHLQLYGAVLDKKSLSGLYAPYADIRKANLEETDLTRADLSYADLRRADLKQADLSNANLSHGRLEGADLTRATLDGADLRGAVIDDSTIAAEKWKNAWCILNTDRNSECRKKFGLAWIDLTNVNLETTDFSNEDMTGADLRNADLSQTNLTGAVLRLADLRYAKLPASRNGTDLEGALGVNQAGSSDTGGAVMRIGGRDTRACLQTTSPEPETAPEISSASPCSESSDVHDKWMVRRLPQGFLVLRSMISGQTGNPTCLDWNGGEPGKYRLHMWTCSDDYATQYWRIMGPEEGFVMLGLPNQPQCLISPERRPNPDEIGTPFLDACNNTIHADYWRIIPK